MTAIRVRLVHAKHRSEKLVQGAKDGAYQGPCHDRKSTMQALENTTLYCTACVASNERYTGWRGPANVTAWPGFSSR